MSSHHNNNATENVHKERTFGDAVTKETVRPEHQEHVTRQVEQDVHQHHHKTVEQPLMDKHVKSEQHHERTLGTEERTFGKQDDSHLKGEMNAARNVQSETQRTGETKHTTTGPDHVSQRVHHHVHEHVQPVVYKETVEPHVTHTTKPVHETHHMKSTHEHGSALPAMGIDEFKSMGSGGHSSTTNGGMTGGTGTGTTGAAGSHAYNTRGTAGQTDTTGTTGSHNPTRDPKTGEFLGHGTDPVGKNATTHGDGKSSTTDSKTGGTGSTGPHSSSLLNKLDPRVDSKGGNDPGFMS